MKQIYLFFVELIEQWKFRRAVKKADYYHHITHRKYFVLVVNRQYCVISKRRLKRLIAERTFRLGVTLADIEALALYVTQ